MNPMEEALLERMRDLSRQCSEQYEIFCMNGGKGASPLHVLLHGLEALHARALAVMALARMTSCAPLICQSLTEVAEGMERAATFLREDYGAQAQEDEQ